MTDSVLHDPLIPKVLLFRLFPAAGSASTLHRRLERGEFPAPAATISGQRHWRQSDLIAWENGRRSGWPPVDDPAAAERAAVAARARAGWKRAQREMTAAAPAA